MGVAPEHMSASLMAGTAGSEDPSQGGGPAYDMSFNSMGMPSQQMILQQQYLMQHQRRLRELWMNELREVQQATDKDVANHAFPLARIKKIMKADEDVRVATLYP
jgi:nuclear transcription factor Y, gamma